MAFPASPNPSDEFTSPSGVRYRWTGSEWLIVPKAVNWGDIVGNVGDQGDLRVAMDGKMNLAVGSGAGNVATFDTVGQVIDGGPSGRWR